jgi:hypothetical protein
MVYLTSDASLFGAVSVPQLLEINSGKSRAPARAGLHVPIEIRPDIGAAPAASLTGKPRLNIGQPDVIRPSIAADRCVVAAMIIGTVDQETANASGAHFSEGDFLLPWGGGGHALALSLRAGRVQQIARRQFDFAFDLHHEAWIEQSFIQCR